MTAKRINVYWTVRHEAALQSVYQQMKADGIPCEREDGEPNVSLIIEYALKQAKRATQQTPAP